MKVHSKDHDYYDTATGGWHTGVHFARPAETVHLTDRIGYWGWGMERNESIFLVGFCGNIYTGIRTQDYNTFKYSYRYEELNIDTTKWEKLFNTMPFFVVIEGIRGMSNLYENPILKNWEFYKVKDAFTAHQDIEMFLTASQQDGKDLKETEAQVLQRHGFNKCTFKGKHTGRKLRRKK